MGADAMVGKPEAMTAEDEAQILASIRKWLERDVRPQVKELEHSDEYPHRMVEQMKELGGGLGLSASLYARIVDHDRRGVDVADRHLQLAPDHGRRVERFGTEAQKEQFLPALRQRRIARRARR